MTKNQPIPWLRIGAESVAIVGSILLAFAIDAWWDSRVERANEQAHLAAVRVQFKETLEMLADQLTVLESAEEATRQILSLDGKEAQANWDMFIGLLGRSLTPGRLNFPSGAIDQLIAGGELRIITDTYLATRLAAWSSFSAEVYENASILLENRDRDIIPFLADYSITGLEFNYSLVNYAPSRFAPDVESMFADPRLESLFAERANSLRNNLDRHRRAEEEANEILSLTQLTLTNQVVLGH